MHDDGKAVVQDERLVRGMGAMGGMQGVSSPPTQQPKKKKKFGIGDVLGRVPLP